MFGTPSPFLELYCSTTPMVWSINLTLYLEPMGHMHTHQSIHSLRIDYYWVLQFGRTPNKSPYRPIVLASHRNITQSLKANYIWIFTIPLGITSTVHSVASHRSTKRACSYSLRGHPWNGMLAIMKFNGSKTVREMTKYLLTRGLSRSPPIMI